MPTLLIKHGWRFYFYANERNEPAHVHVEKGNIECKYWLKPDLYDVEEVYAYNLSPSARRQVRRLLFENFDYFVEEYQKTHGRS